MNLLDKMKTRLSDKKKHFNDSVDKAIKMTRADYTQDEWDRIVNVLELIHLINRTLIMAGLVIIGLWVYAEVTNQELHITGKDYCCYPCPNNTYWSVQSHPMQPVQELPPNQYILPASGLEPCIDNYSDAEHYEQQEERVAEVNRTP